MKFTEYLREGEDTSYKAKIQKKIAPHKAKSEKNHKEKMKKLGEIATVKEYATFLFNWTSGLPKHRNAHSGDWHDEAFHVGTTWQRPAHLYWLDQAEKELGIK